MNKTYKEPATLTDVAEFMNTFGQDVINRPGLPSAEICKLRVDLIQEELNELKTAIEEDDIVEVADALADLQYVLSGAIHAFGMGTVFQSLFNEVHRSNMSKACKSKEEAAITISKYHDEGISTYYQENEDKYLVKRRGDNKVLKAFNYSPANLLPVLSGIMDVPVTPKEAFYQPHQQRVIDEKNELDAKVVSLLDFISNNPIYSTLDPKEQADLYMQLQQMMHYSDTLNRRIRRFTNE